MLTKELSAAQICDHVTSVLMTYIILFSSDFVELQDKRQVERVQHGYVKLLERHTYSQVRYLTTTSQGP